MITPPPDSQSSYNPPAVLSWRIGDGVIDLEIPLSIDLCHTLEDDDVVALSEAVEIRLKALYPTYRIARLLSWNPSAPAVDVQTVVQEAQQPG
ncbi:hypothetical protein [Streptomyces griseus]|uniref:hypothetical protein n=1 Tax=Streptomyces griseus TaxID=1911 RepID=UPI0036F880BA